MINHIIIKCSKLVPKEYKTRHDWMGMAIHRELCKKFQFDHTNKCYMYYPKFVRENATQKLFWDFEISYLDQTTRPSERQQKKKKRT